MEKVVLLLCNLKIKLLHIHKHQTENNNLEFYLKTATQTIILSIL